MVFVLAGGFLGFWAALVGWLLLGLSPGMTLLLWGGSGPASALLALGWSLLRPRRGGTAEGRPLAPAA